jgi:hypothetical protein
MPMLTHSCNVELMCRGCSEAVLKTSVFVAQKRLIRALAGKRAVLPADSSFCSTRPLLDKLDLLPIYSHYLFEACKFVWQNILSILDPLVTFMGKCDEKQK